jgi:hypothetical protein
MKKAIVARARRLAVIMHSMWVDGTFDGAHTARQSEARWVTRQSP